MASGLQFASPAPNYTEGKEKNKLGTRETAPKQVGKIESLMETLQWYQGENALVVRYTKRMIINQ